MGTVGYGELRERGAAVVHKRLLVTRLGDQSPVSAIPRVFALDPRIDPTLTGGPGLAAITPATARLRPRRRPHRTAGAAPGVPDRFGDAAGRHDLGAVERDDVLFFGGFGQRVPAPADLMTPDNDLEACRTGGVAGQACGGIHRCR